MNQNQFKCEICGALYGSQEQLDEHKHLYHSPYTCDVCGQAFSSGSELEAHRSVVHSERQKMPNR